MAIALVPFFQSLVAGFMILFLLAGVAYGQAAGTVKTHRDVVSMMAEAMKYAIEAGRLAYLAGRMPKKLYASASSPLDGLIG